MKNLIPNCITHSLRASHFDQRKRYRLASNGQMSHPKDFQGDFVHPSIVRVDE
jgi:hypothetical protein